VTCQLFIFFFQKDLISEAFLFVNGEKLGTANIPYVKEDCLEEEG